MRADNAGLYGSFGHVCRAEQRVGENGGVEEMKKGKIGF